MNEKFSFHDMATQAPRVVFRLDNEIIQYVETDLIYYRVDRNNYPLCTLACSSNNLVFPPVTAISSSS